MSYMAPGPDSQPAIAFDALPPVLTISSNSVARPALEQIVLAMLVALLFASVASAAPAPAAAISHARTRQLSCAAQADLHRPAASPMSELLQPLPRTPAAWPCSAR